MSWLTGHAENLGLYSLRLNPMKLLIFDCFYYRSSNFIGFNSLLDKEGIGNSEFSKVINFKLILTLGKSVIRQEQEINERKTFRKLLQ